jgi:hypothetical protein
MTRRPIACPAPIPSILTLCAFLFLVPARAETPSATLPTVDFWAAERIVERFRLLHRLVGDTLLEPQRYEKWARDNQGAFLLLTAPPPLQGLSAKVPSYDSVASYLRAIKQERADIASAERTALLDSLMPTEGPRAAPVQPPRGTDLPRWIELLDRLNQEKLLPAKAIATEKAALDVAAVR